MSRKLEPPKSICIYCYHQIVLAVPLTYWILDGGYNGMGHHWSDPVCRDNPGYFDGTSVGHKPTPQTESTSLGG